MLTLKIEIEEKQQKRADSFTAFLWTQFWLDPFVWWPWLLSDSLKIPSCDYRQCKKWRNSFIKVLEKEIKNSLEQSFESLVFPNCRAKWDVKGHLWKKIWHYCYCPKMTEVSWTNSSTSRPDGIASRIWHFIHQHQLMVPG